MEREITCCFTGHRPAKLPWKNDEHAKECVKFKKELYAAVENAYLNGWKKFICGMAQGCDTFFGEAVLALKFEYSDIFLEAAIPCPTQSERWNSKEIARYNNILEYCDKITTIQSEYTPGCMKRRNMYMVDNSSLLIAASNGSPGGTASTIQYAFEQKIKVEILSL